MPARPLTNKMLIMRLLDELAEYGLSEEEVDRTLVRDGPVDLDLLAECKQQHPFFNTRMPSFSTSNEWRLRSAFRRT